VKERMAAGVLTYVDFDREFENNHYSRYHQKNKEQKFLAIDFNTFSCLLLFIYLPSITKLKDLGMVSNRNYR
jgi:hypothetical protein